MTSWLEPLIDPHELAVSAQRGNTEPQAGLALLLGGDLLLYERLARDAGWPPLGQRPRRSMTRENQLLAAVTLQLTGDRAVTGAYELAARPGRVGMSFLVVAAVLQSIHLADQGSHEEAVDVLSRRLQASEDPLERKLLELHVGVREVDRGELDRAIEATERSLAIGARRERAWGSAMRTVAAHNIARYRQLQGKYPDPFRLPLRGAEPALARGAVGISVGLSRFLTDQFDQVTRDRYARGFQWRAEDPVEMPLLGALVRAECLGDWAEQRRVRALLARYYVVSKLGTAEGVDPSTFDLLRRAGDSEGTQAATRSVSAIGPLGSLRAATVAALARPWPRPEQSSTLALLGGGADLLEPGEADRALSRLRSDPQVVVATAPIGTRTLARVLLSASDKAQVSGSRLALKIARTWPQPIVLQEMGRVVEALRWTEVSASERKRWIGYIDEHLLDDKDARFLAERAAGALVQAEPTAIGRLLLRAFQDHPTLDRLAYLLDARIALPRDVRATALELVTGSLDRIRNAAASGSYAFGGTDAALLLLALVRRTPKSPHWDTLVDFLLDDRVGIDDKTRTFTHLASPSISIPRRAQARLRGGLRDVKGFATPVAGSPSTLRAAALRLWLRLGGVPRDELLSRLLELAGDTDADARREGARTLPAAQRRLGDDAAFTLALVLTRDHDYSVRAAAARSLASLRQGHAGELGSVANDRLELLLEEPGTDVVVETLSGLIEAQRGGVQLEKRIVEQVARVRRSHPSRRVQWLCELFSHEAKSGSEDR